MSRIICNDIMLPMDTKRPRGRPPVDDGATALVQFRVEPDRKERYERAAKRAGKALSAWIKAVCDRASRR